MNLAKFNEKILQSLQNIQLTLKLDHPERFEEILDVFFRKLRSPLLPIYVTSDIGPVVQGETEIDHFFYNYRIVEAQDNPNEDDSELARIWRKDFPPLYTVFFERSENITDEDWGKVEKMVQKIISQLQLLQIEIISVEPRKLLPENLSTFLEEREDKNGESGLSPEVSITSLGTSTSISSQEIASEGIEDDKQPDESGLWGDIRLPRGANQIKKWILVAAVIRKRRGLHESLEDISKFMKRNHQYDHLPHDPDTLSKIEKADLAGKLR
jgi:hypothetical protein